ncbi:hypothetical protein Micbo1qcDRAFT_50870 [Microdochium bolleyi]|uniref:Uncharacterized protein n=1 Tax=Microdochium bolleyi TaxID=196109 RepID=A0A136J6E6_9PEZI|nr:hypothetical protein Micbo1qcDRAFT_50870 [Microdochium bolleyi]
MWEAAQTRSRPCISTRFTGVCGTASRALAAPTMVLFSAKATSQGLYSGRLTQHRLNLGAAQGSHSLHKAVVGCPPTSPAFNACQVRVTTLRSRSLPPILGLP